MRVLRQKGTVKMIEEEKQVARVREFFAEAGGDFVCDRLYELANDRHMLPADFVIVQVLRALCNAYVGAWDRDEAENVYIWFQTAKANALERHARYRSELPL